MRTKLFAGVAFAALIMPSAAYAQSTGSTDFEGETEIVVTGTAAPRSVGGIQLPDTPKSKVVIDSELIRRQRPGQSVNDIINLSPGVSFQNNDATGSAGGTFTIRGFDSSRISQTQDGIPLNDTGNYALFSNQQQDPETLDSINVNLGSTDVDSPTASAAGGTINIRTRVPGEELGGMVSATAGYYAASGAPRKPITRVFGMIDTGDFTGIGTRAFVSASTTNAPVPFNRYGKIQKSQFNGRVYQDIGSSGDFIAVAVNYNQNRNNFLGSSPLRNDVTQSPTNSAIRIAGTQSGNRFPATRAERFYNINFPCNTTTPRFETVAPGEAPAAAPAAPTSGASCGTEFDRRYNPSNTGNIRGNSRFTLADGLVLTIDPSFQYVKANGGGTVTATEGFGTLTGTRPAGSTTTPYYGVLNTGPNTGNVSPSGFATFVGRDLNGDGDMLDTVTVLDPSQTQTRRYGVIGSLAYELSDNHRIRVTYTFDRGRHRQTGEAGLLAPNGEPYDVFPVNKPIVFADGNSLQKRDRLSYATLNQVSGEYRGEFFDNTVTVVLGLRAPFFQRDLQQNCFTVAGNGNVSCVTPSQVPLFAAANPYTYFAAGQTTVGGVSRPAGTNACTNAVTCVIGFAPPQKRTYKYDKLLPNVGVTIDLTSSLSYFASYTKGLSVPSTDTLYNAFFFPIGTAQATPQPETTDSFDAGWRYRSHGITAQLSSWYIRYQNRIASAYDPELDQVIFRNLGQVNKWGVDASVSYKPIPELLLYVFGSYLHSEIVDNLDGGKCTQAQINSGQFGCTTLNAQIFLPTKGKRESGSPVYTLGTRVQGTLGPVDLGIQAKWTGKRYINDENLPILQANGTTGFFQAYPAATPEYALVDLDVRLNMEQWGLDKTYLQLNVSNLFDKFYVGGFGGSANQFSVPFVQIGVPRSITASLIVGF